ncbi:MAG: hypothetical protein JSS34_02130 [Proteobacteria bacterium]|nr:hypothetical protein [Pseudomonadota bacterium]
MFYRIFFMLLIILCIGFGFCFYKAERLLFLTDLSTRPLEKFSNPDFQAPLYNSRAPVYLISYADGPEVFFQNQYALAQSSLGRGVDFILNYRKSLLDPQFVSENKEIIDQPKGAGYWLWKPWIILKTLKSVPENAIVIYSDTGNLIKASLTPLIKLAEQHPILLSVYENKEIWGWASKKVKRDVFMSLNCDTPECHNGSVLWAGFMIFRNTPEAREFVQMWLKYAQDPELLTDLPSKYESLPDAAGHCHDQAILTVLYHKDPKNKYLMSYDDLLMKNHLAWKHRKPCADKLFIYESLIPYYGYTLMRKIDRLFFNNYWLKKLRENLNRS